MVIRSLQEDFFQDAHEFLIFLINHINEIIVGEQSGGAGISISKPKSPETETENSITWINEIFQVSTIFCDASPAALSITHAQGILTSETRCLNCETVTSKDEEFCDLSIDVDQVTKRIT